jgi:hypothetical protein
VAVAQELVCEALVPEAQVDCAGEVASAQATGLRRITSASRPRKRTAS